MEALKGKKILVTGGAGFIGSHIVDRLAPENYVTVLDNLFTGSQYNLSRSRNRIDFIKGDILDKELVTRLASQADYIFHLAARTSVTGSVKDPLPDMETNILGTINILEACRDTGLERLVLSSSAAVFGDAERLPVDENHPLNPKSPYAVSKLAAEKYALNYYHAYAVPAVALRYFNVYGPRQDTSEYANVLSIFLRAFKARRPVTVYGDGEQTRDFIFVQDIVAANLLAAVSPKAPGETFNIATGEAPSINKVIEIIQRLSGWEGQVNYVAERAGEIRYSQASIEKAGNLLGYRPKITLDQGLKSTWESLD